VNSSETLTLDMRFRTRLLFSRQSDFFHSPPPWNWGTKTIRLSGLYFNIFSFLPQCNNFTHHVYRDPVSQ